MFSFEKYARGNKNSFEKYAYTIDIWWKIGKTYIIDKFAKENYEHYTYINFVENPAYEVIFDGDMDIETLIKQITLRVSNADLVEGNSLIFLDEIQCCPRARTALKFFALDSRFERVFF